jgi:hypothetical protein
VLVSAFSAASSASAAPSFRLLLLIGLFRFLALQARPAGRGAQIDTFTDYWFVVVNLLAGSLIGAWIWRHLGHADALNHPAPPFCWCLLPSRSHGTARPGGCGGRDRMP